ncbi:MAG: ribosome maturation factor RimP [Pseudomonadales bacterium]
MNRREKELETLLAPAIEALGYEIWGLEFLQQGRHSKLRVYIDQPDGVTVDDCERASREISDVLDVEDALAQSYTLEVSSPGMDRILFKPEQYRACAGEMVDVRLNVAFEGSKRVVGQLAGLENDEVIVQVEDEQYLLPLENIQRARVVPQFD